MPKAFVMIDVHPGHELEVQAALQKLDKVEFSYQVTGNNDMIAFVNAEPYTAFASVVSNIRGLEGVKDTDTMLVLDK